jgi:hypothetical protein
VATLPGSAFGAPDEDLVLRLAASYVDMENDEKAAALLAAYRADPTRLLDDQPALRGAVGQIGRFVERLKQS